MKPWFPLRANQSQFLSGSLPLAGRAGEGVFIRKQGQRDFARQLRNDATPISAYIVGMFEQECAEVAERASEILCSFAISAISCFNCFRCSDAASGGLRV